MYCLNIVLIGGDESVLPHVRREALNHGATIEAQFRDIPSAMHVLVGNTNKGPLFIVCVECEVELAQFRRLSGAFIDWLQSLRSRALADIGKLVEILARKGQEPKPHRNRLTLLGRLGRAQSLSQRPKHG